MSGAVVSESLGDVLVKDRPAVARASMIDVVGCHGGMHNYDTGLCAGLTKAGVDVALFSDFSPTSPDEPGFAVRKVYSGVLGHSSPKWLRLIRYLSGTLSALTASVRERRSIVHFHWFNAGALELLTAVLARLAFRRIVVTAHDVRPLVSREWPVYVGSFAYQLVHRVICHNATSRDELQARFQISAEKLSVVRHGNYLDSTYTSLQELPSRSDSRRKLGLPDDVPVVLFFGAIKEAKGLDLLLQALPAVKAEEPEVVLLIAGKPMDPGFDQYAKLIEELDLQTSCRLTLEFISDEDAVSYFKAADIVVLPYKRIYQSGVLLLAMTLGAPVLVSDLPGMTELIEDGVNGRVFRSGDPADLAAQMVMALRDPQAAQMMADKSAEQAAKDFDWADIGHSTRDVYAEVSA